MKTAPRAPRSWFDRRVRQLQGRATASGDSRDTELRDLIQARMDDLPTPDVAPACALPNYIKRSGRLM